ncbi:MAG: AAA family ATPase [Cyanobacteria bacterium P01_G01_bin.19]
MNNVSELIKQMLQPTFYPHPTVENIDLVQTHASYVFLTGEYAYKVKKEVDFGFLDYSTLAKRKHFLDRELELNREVAPELYIEVIAIARCNGELVLGDANKIVEYTLKMRQFPQENLFSNLLQTGELDSECIKKLGKIVAEFHQQAKTSDYISSFGTVAKIKAAFDENYRQSQKYIGVVQTQEQYAETKTYSDRIFTERQDLFEQRVTEQKIKECHGDLHLNNICWWQDKILLFDRIEFNESFRFVDTMYDVAFVMMDLEAKHRVDLANVFLNSYLEQTGDWSGLLILPLYLSRQAYVRAKVNSFLLDDTQVSEADKRQAQKTARDYYRQAYQYTQIDSGSILIMSGLSGSGKSTVAQEIARNLGAIQIRSDAVRKHIAGITLDKTREDIYTPEMTQKTYNRLMELGIMLSKEGYKVILDAKYDRLNLRQAIAEQAKANSIPLRIIHCTAPISVLRDRLNQRQNDVSDATANLLQNQQANAEDFTSAEQNIVTTIDTSQTNWRERNLAQQLLDIEDV